MATFIARPFRSPFCCEDGATMPPHVCFVKSEPAQCGDARLSFRNILPA